MKAYIQTLLGILVILLLSGCASKKEQMPQIRYIYRTKYVYMPCIDKKPIKLSDETKITTKKPIEKKKIIKKEVKNRIKIKKQIKKITKIKKKPKIIAKKRVPQKYKKPKETTIFAPKKYIKRANKKMDFMIGINRDGSNFVYMEGEFGVDTFNRFILFLKESGTSAKEVKIDSNGGVVSSAMQIGAYVYDHGFSTGVDAEMHCYSACSFVYFAGREKSLGGEAKVGLHRPYIPGKKDTPQSIRKTKRDYISYWNYIHAPKSIYDEMMAVGRKRLFILDRSNINDYIDVKLH